MKMINWKQNDPTASIPDKVRKIISATLNEFMPEADDLTVQIVATRIGNVYLEGINDGLRAGLVALIEQGKKFGRQ
jgi:hypothetical protein